MKLKSSILFAALLVALYFVLITVPVVGAVVLERSTAQAILFPIVIIYLWRIGAGDWRWPLGGLSAALICASFSLSYTYIFSLNERGGVVFALLEADELQKQTRIFRELVNEQGRHAALKLTSHSTSIRDAGSAASFLRRRSNLVALVWGGRRWINVSFQDIAPATLGELGLSEALPKLYQLKLIRSVPIIGLSFEPQDASSAFLADLFEGLTYQAKLMTPMSEAREEIALWEAGSRVGRWSASAHRAYPWWVLANRYLVKAVISPAGGYGQFDCAINSYLRARAFIGRGDNRELSAAIHNNLALAQYLKYILTGETALRTAALDNFKIAMKSISEPDIFGIVSGGSDIAAENLGLLTALKRGKSESQVRLTKRARPEKKREKRR